MHNEGDIIPRFLQRPNRSFFLFGRRGTGKSTWLQQVLSDAFRLDLLEASLFPELSRGPHRLEALAGGRPQGHCVVLDEIQKAPALLDEVTVLWNRGGGALGCAARRRKEKGPDRGYQRSGARD
jgi:hypothetical protein